MLRGRGQDLGAHDHRHDHDRHRPGHRRSLPRRTLDWRLRFGALSLIWGFSFLLIKVGTDGYAPFQVTFGRLLFGTAVLAAAMAVKRERLPRGGRTWVHLTVAAFLLNALPFSLFAYSELTIPSTLAGICNATSPLWGMALSLVALSEDRPTRVRVAGLGLGFLGVLTVLGAWQGFSGLDARGTAMALLASLCYAIGWIYVRRTLAGTGSSHLSLTGAQLLLATVQLAVVTPLFTSMPTHFPLLPSWRSPPWAPWAPASPSSSSTAWSPKSGPPPPRWSPTSSRSSPRRRGRDPGRVADVVDSGGGGDRAGGGGTHAGEGAGEAVGGGGCEGPGVDVRRSRPWHRRLDGSERQTHSGGSGRPEAPARPTWPDRLPDAPGDRPQT